MDRKRVSDICNHTGLDFPFALIKRYNEKSFVCMIKKIKKELKEELLPQLKLFKKFYVVFSEDRNSLGTYIGGSYHTPIMMLNLNCIKIEAIKKDLSYSYVVETTILHELGHAIQDYYNTKFDEDWAEDFANDYYNYGIVNEIEKVKNF